MASKDKGWKRSWKARCSVAILNMNQGYEWVLLLYEVLNLDPLSPECMARLERRDAYNRALSSRLSDSEFQRLVRMDRADNKKRRAQLS
jgi:hypothetical protein